MRLISLIRTQRSLVSDAMSGRHGALLDTDAQIASSVDLILPVLWSWMGLIMKCRPF